jgi:SNF2 family DNA or RNA helicase
MKLTFSKPDHPAGRHCVLVCSADEEWGAIRVIEEEVLKGKARPVKEYVGTQTLIRFNMRFFGRLLLAFPMADLSPAIYKQMRKDEDKRLKSMPVPTCSWPGLKKGTELRDYQKIAADLIVRGEIDFLGDDMGLGKTVVALTAIRKLNAYPALVVCPNSVKVNAWAADIDKFFPGVSYAVVEGTKAQRAELIRKRADVTIINFEGIRAKAVHKDDNPYAPIVGYTYSNPDLFDFPYEFAVVDEHHRVKTPDAQVTRGFLELLAHQWLLLSGTPILNRVEEIWTCLHKIYPETFPSYNAFVNAIGIENPNRPGHIVGYRPDVMAELKEFLYGRGMELGVSLRRRKDQVLKDLPEVVRVKQSVTLSAEERKLYDQIRDDFLLELEDGTVKSIVHVLPQITRLKQAAFSPELYGGSKKSSKIKELKNVVAELVSEGHKAIVFSQWSKATNIIKRELSEYNPAYVTGEVLNKDRPEQIRKFQEDEDCWLYIGTIGANREGINLGAATYVIFTDFPWTPAEAEQAIARSAAGGLRGAGRGIKHVHVIELQAEDTIEERIQGLLARKQATFNRLVERDAGNKVERITVNDLKSLL